MPRKKTRSPETLAKDIAKAVWGIADDGEVEVIRKVIEKTFDPAGTLKFTLEHPMLWWWRAKVVSVTDGDTMDVFLDRGFRDTHTERVRLHRVNAWETRGRKAKTEGERGRKATRWVKSILKINREILVHTTGPDDRGSFGRWLAQLWVPTTEREADAAREIFMVNHPGNNQADIDAANRMFNNDDMQLVNIGEWMLELGHARPYKR